MNSVVQIIYRFINRMRRRSASALKSSEQQPGARVQAGAVTLAIHKGQQLEDSAAIERVRYEEVLNQSSIPMILLLGSEHRIAFMNPAYQARFNLKADSIGKKIIDVLPESSAQGFLGLLDRVYQTGETFEGRDSFFSWTDDKNAAHDAYLDFTYAAKRNASNEIEGVLAVIVDVTERVRTRQTLEASERAFRMLADSMPPHVWTADRFGKLDYFNAVALKYSGFTLDENLSGGKWADWIHPDDAVEAAREWSEAVENKSTYFHEVRLRSARGDYRWFRINAQPSFADGGQVNKWFGTNTDVHDSKLMTDELRAAKLRLEDEQQKFKTIFAASSTSMALLRGPKFVYEAVNASYLQLFNNRDLIDRPLLEAIPELIGQKFPEEMDRAYETGVAYKEKEAKAFLRRTSDGPLEERYFNQSYSRVDDVHGNPYGMYIHAQDVSDLVFARRELEQSSERLRIALEIADMGTWSLDVATGQVTWSARCAELFGFPGELELPISRVLTHVLEEDAERTQNAIEAAMLPDSNGEYTIDYRVRHPDGSVHWFSVLGKVFFRATDIGRVAETFLGVVIDITGRMTAAEQLREAKDRAERANAAKSQFLANMSHEIRTPLGAIMGFASLLRDPSVGREQNDSFLSVIERNSTQLLRIIDDILDLSKVEAGMMLIEQIEFSLPEMLTDFSSLMGFKAREKGIGFSSVAATPLPSIIKTDPTRLRQILINVVGNAIKFTDAGTVELRTSYLDGILQFEVHDTGRGISTEQEANLFQPFAQADASTTRKYGGTGLGLVLTRSLAEALGGSFVLKSSQLEKGSVFSVQIRVEIQPGADFVKGLGFETVPVRSFGGAGQLSGLKVLLVEDSPDNQALFSIFLNRAGARIDIASDGLQGYNRAMSGEYDIVLMDVQMPVMDGISAIRRLRAEGYRKTVIALTAHAMKEERVRCLEAGFTDFLSKPVTRQELVEKILRYRSL